MQNSPQEISEANPAAERLEKELLETEETEMTDKLNHVDFLEDYDIKGHMK